jgi:hypothetical protein
MGSACGKSGEPTENVIDSTKKSSSSKPSDIKVPGILHLVNEASNGVIDKHIFQTFISKHPHGPEAFWSNPKDFSEPFDSTTFFQAYSKGKCTYIATLPNYDLYICFQAFTNKTYVTSRCNCWPNCTISSH